MKSFAVSAVLAAAFGFGAAVPVGAQSVNAFAPGTVIAAMQDAGLNATLRGTEGSAPVVETDIEGVSFAVFFNNCSEGANCQDLQFRASFTARGITTDVINSWNRKTFIGKAYVSADGNVVLEHPILGVDGMSRYAFRRTLIGWNAALTGFRKTFNATE